MKYVVHFAKKYVLSTIGSNVSYNAVTIPIYGDVPATAQEPYMVVTSVSQDDIDRNSDNFSYDAVIQLEVVTKFGRGRQNSSISEQIMSDAMQLIRPLPSSTLDMSADNLSNYSIELVNTTMLKEEYPNDIYVRLISDIGFRIE